MALALVALVSVILCAAVLTGRVSPRQRPGVLPPDSNLVRRKAVAFLAADASVLLNMIGFLVFPDRLVVVTAVLLPLWIASLVLLIRLQADVARPRG